LHFIVVVVCIHTRKMHGVWNLLYLVVDRIHTRRRGFGEFQALVYGAVGALVVLRRDEDLILAHSCGSISVG
jgi:hypothetical protein